MIPFVEDVVARARQIQEGLLRDPTFRGLIGTSPTIPRPFLGSGPVRLVIIGQDPTVQRESSRAAITTVLNIDKTGALRTYINRLCKDLSLDLDTNVYATNFAKGFFSDPPTTLLRAKSRDVLGETAAVWLPLLLDELAQFPGAVVVSLGEPLLPVLIRPERPREMKHYWGWQTDWRAKGPKPFSKLTAEDTTIGRVFFPFVHQPTMRGSRSKYYRERRDEYVEFIRDMSGLLL